MKKKKLIKLFIILLAFCVFTFQFSQKVHGSSSVKLAKVIVYPGDTLWSIASENIKGHSDIRKLVYNIRKINKLDSAIITPGQEIMIPVE